MLLTVVAPRAILGGAVPPTVSLFSEVRSTKFKDRGVFGVSGLLRWESGISWSF